VSSILIACDLVVSTSWVCCLLRLSIAVTWQILLGFFVWFCSTFWIPHTKQYLRGTLSPRPRLPQSSRPSCLCSRPVGGSNSRPRWPSCSRPAHFGGGLKAHGLTSSSQPFCCSSLCPRPPLLADVCACSPSHLTVAFLAAYTNRFVSILLVYMLMVSLV